MRRIARPLLSLGIAAVLASCATRSSAPDLPGSERDRSIHITIDNQEFQDATIYTVYAGSRQRLGMVTGKRSQTFTVDWPHPDLQLAVQFLAAGSFLTERIPVVPGDHVELQIWAGSSRVRE